MSTSISSVNWPQRESDALAWLCAPNPQQESHAMWPHGEAGPHSRVRACARENSSFSLRFGTRIVLQRAASTTKSMASPMPEPVRADTYTTGAYVRPGSLSRT